MDTDKLVEQARDEDVLAAMIRLRLLHVLRPAGTALAESYKSTEHGERRWSAFVDEATRVVMRDVVAGLADAVEQLQRERDEANEALGWVRVDRHNFAVAREEARARVAALEAALGRAVDVIGGVWNGSVETLDEARGEARSVYHDGLALLDSGEDD